MKTVLVEVNGEIKYVEIHELDVHYYLGGAPLTFCGTIEPLDAVILIKLDYPGGLNPYVIPGVPRFRGRALIIKTDDEGAPIDMDLDEYEHYVAWFNNPVAFGTRIKLNKKKCNRPM